MVATGAAGIGPLEIVLVLLLALVATALVALLVVRVVRSVARRPPGGAQTWPLAESASPFQAHQAVAARLGSLGVTPWGIEVDRSVRSVTVELVRPASARLADDIRRTLAPLQVDVVSFRGGTEQEPAVSEDRTSDRG